MPHHHLTPTLNFAPANAIPWHTSVHNKYATAARPSTVWRFVPVPLSRDTEPTTSTHSPESLNSDPQQSEVVYRYTAAATEAPASFTTSGTPRRARHHVRLFSNAHQYKRDMEASSTAASPPLETVDVPPDLVETVEAAEGSNAIDDVDDDDKHSPWFKQLLGQVLAATEMADH